MKNQIAWAIKIIAGTFNGLSSYYVFFPILKAAGRPDFLAYLSAFLAVLLIDALFIYVLLILEDTKIHVLDKLPYLVLSFLLVVATIAVGFKDEGWMSFVPRVGFIMIVLSDAFVVVSEFYRYYWSREAQEKRLRDRQVLLRLSVKSEAYKDMITSDEMHDNFVLKEYQREMDNLNLDVKQSTPLPEPVLSYIAEPQSLPEYVEQVEESIFQLPSGGYGWADPVTGEVNTTTALGKPYTLQGARSALSRTRNGHNA